MHILCYEKGIFKHSNNFSNTKIKLNEVFSSQYVFHLIEDKLNFLTLLENLLSIVHASEYSKLKVTT